MNKLAELADLAERVAVVADPLLALALRCVLTVASTLEPQDLERLVRLLDLFLQQLIATKLARLDAQEHNHALH